MSLSIKTQNKIKYLACILFFLLNLKLAKAQPISLENALELAIKNNTQIKIANLKSEYAQSLINTSKDIPKANLISEWGQVNSFYFDTKVGIGQTFELPIVYKNQRKTYNEEWKYALLDQALKAYELKQAIHVVYFKILYLYEKQKLLYKADTLYVKFYEKALQRLKSGESNILEKITAENQKFRIENQLNQLNLDLKNALIEFRFLLNTNNPYLPKDTVIKYNPTPQVDSVLIFQNPSLKIEAQKINIINSRIQLQKSKLLPVISVGYVNNSFRGMGPNNINYNAFNRFHSLQMGLEIPIFKKAEKAKLNSLKISQLVETENEKLSKQMLKSNQDKYNNELKYYENQIVYFETNGIINAKVIYKTAQNQFLNGEINYLEYVILINQSIELEINYIDTINTLNEIKILKQFNTLK